MSGVEWKEMIEPQASRGKQDRPLAEPDPLPHDPGHAFRR